MEIAILSTNNELFHLVRHARRSKRSYFNGIGNLLHTLTGVMDNDDSTKIYESIKNLDVVQQKLLESQKHQTFFIKSMYQRINESEELTTKGRNNTAVIMKQMIENLNLLAGKQTLAQSKFTIMDLSLIISTELNNILRRQNSIISILSSVRLGKTYPMILDPNLLNKLCMQTLLSLKLEYSVDSCQTITDLIRVTSFYYNNELLIQVTIPQVNEQSYNLYKLFITPIPVSST